jgi:hypothetical protein
LLNKQLIIKEIEGCEDDSGWLMIQGELVTSIQPLLTSLVDTLNGLVPGLLDALGGLLTGVTGEVRGLLDGVLGGLGL